MSDGITKYWEMVEDGTMPPPDQLEKEMREKEIQRLRRNLRINNPDEIRNLATEMAKESTKHSNDYDLAEALEKMLITFLK
jgi:hypothetical protein